MQDAHAPTDIDHQILQVVHKSGTITFDALHGALHRYGFVAVFGTVDRLTRCGVLRMVRVGREYELSAAVTWSDALAALQDTGTRDRANGELASDVSLVRRDCNG